MYFDSARSKERFVYGFEWLHEQVWTSNWLGELYEETCNEYMTIEHNLLKRLGKPFQMTDVMFSNLLTWPANPGWFLILVVEVVFATLLCGFEIIRTVLLCLVEFFLKTIAFLAWMVISAILSMLVDIRFFRQPLIATVD